MKKIVHQGKWEQTNSSTLTKKKKKKREAFLYRRKLLKSISHDGMAKPGVWETRTNDLH